MARPNPGICTDAGETRAIEFDLAEAESFLRLLCCKKRRKGAINTPRPNSRTAVRIMDFVCAIWRASPSASHSLTVSWISNGKLGGLIINWHVEVKASRVPRRIDKENLSKTSAAF